MAPKSTGAAIDPIQTALKHHQAGRLAQAEAIYRDVLRTKPDHADALHLLGVIALQGGRHEIAVDLIGKAIKVNPSVPDFYSNCGDAWRAMERLNEAVACYEKALQLKPDFPLVRNNLGNALKDQGKIPEAIACYQKAIQLKPDFHEAYNGLGNALKDQGHSGEAIACYEKAIRLKPDFFQAYNNLGNTWLDQGKQLKPLWHCPPGSGQTR